MCVGCPRFWERHTYNKLPGFRRGGLQILKMKGGSSLMFFIPCFEGFSMSLINNSKIPLKISLGRTSRLTWQWGFHGFPDDFPISRSTSPAGSFEGSISLTVGEMLFKASAEAQLQYHHVPNKRHHHDYTMGLSLSLSSRLFESYIQLFLPNQAHQRPPAAEVFSWPRSLSEPQQT